jgi:hypothetical protein
MISKKCITRVRTRMNKEDRLQEEKSGSEGQQYLWDTTKINKRQIKPLLLMDGLELEMLVCSYQGQMH